MIEWKPLPQKPQDELEETTYLIYLPNSERAITATHDAASCFFIYTTDDTEHVFPYRYISHYAEVNFPEKSSGQLCEGCLFELQDGRTYEDLCDDCAERAGLTLLP